MSYDIFQALCESRHVRPADVSKATGVSPAALSCWKSGEYTPKTDKLQRIADFFDVPLEYLLTGEIKSHFTDGETATIAQEILNDNDMRLLFDAARGSSPDDLRMVREMLLALKRKAND